MGNQVSIAKIKPVRNINIEKDIFTDAEWEAILQITKARYGSLRSCVTKCLNAELNTAEGRELANLIERMKNVH